MPAVTPRAVCGEARRSDRRTAICGSLSPSPIGSTAHAASLPVDDVFLCTRPGRTCPLQCNTRPEFVLRRVSLPESGRRRSCSAFRGGPRLRPIIWLVPLGGKSLGTGSRIREESLRFSLARGNAGSTGQTRTVSTGPCVGAPGRPRRRKGRSYYTKHPMTQWGNFPVFSKIANPFPIKGRGSPRHSCLGSETSTPHEPEASATAVIRPEDAAFLPGHSPRKGKHVSRKI